MKPCPPWQGNQGRKPSQCELHREYANPELYDCSITVKQLKKLSIDCLPEEVTLHLPLYGDVAGRVELEKTLPAILFTEISFSRSQVGYLVDVETQDWLDLLFETLVVADLVKPPAYDWESRFDFIECPEPKEYMSEIIKLAKASNFTTDGLELEARAELVRADYPKLKSIYGSIVETMRPVNDALLDFLCRRIVVYDSGLDRELPLHPWVKNDPER
jgi:hypothetical protein